MPFNLTVPTPYNTNTRSTYSQAMLQSYLVDNQGYIQFPIVGALKVGGLTKSEAEQLIQTKIRHYMNAEDNASEPEEAAHQDPQDYSKLKPDMAVLLDRIPEKLFRP